MKQLKMIPFLALLLLATAVQADRGKMVDVDELKPSHVHRQASVIITRVVDRYHYRKVPLDNKMSKAVFKRYLESLDPNRSYFTQKDIKNFSRFETRIDDALKKAWLNPAFDIYKTYRKRVDSRVKNAVKLLKTNHDFGADEDYRFDRSDDQWAKNEKVLDETWRKRVKKGGWQGLRR